MSLNIFILSKLTIIGGAEQMVCAIANHLSSSCNVHLALRTTADFDLTTLNLSSDVTVLRVTEPPFPDISKPRNWLKINWKHFWKLSKYIRKHKIDIIYAHDISVAQGAILKLLTFKPLVWHNHNGEMPNFTEEKKRKYSKYLFNTDAIISVNEELTQYCRQHFGHSKRSFYTLDNFFTHKNKEKNTLLPSGFNIVHVANIRNVKNQLLLLSAFDIYKRKNPDTNLIFIGKAVEPEYEQKLTHAIHKSEFKSSIYLLGSRDDIMSILDQAHIAVLVSQNEAFPLVLLEYGMSGTPILATAIKSCNDILKNGDFGMLVKTDDAQAIADGFETIDRQYEVYRQKSANFRDYIEINYSADAITTKLKTILSSHASA